MFLSCYRSSGIVLRKKFNFLFNKEELIFSTADFLSFSQFSLYYWGGNNKLSWSWRKPSSFAHHAVPFLTRSKWSTYWALLDRASTKVRSTMMFSWHSYSLMLTNRVTAVAFLGWDLCRKQSQIISSGVSPSSPAPARSVPAVPAVLSPRGAARLAGAADGPQPPKCQILLPMLSITSWIASTTKRIYFI